MLERAPNYDLVQYVHRVSKAIASAMIKRAGSTTSQVQEMALPLAVKELPVSDCLGEILKWSHIPSCRGHKREYNRRSKVHNT